MLLPAEPLDVAISIPRLLEQTLIVREIDETDVHDVNAPC
jgi:hypothetical protein